MGNKAKNKRTAREMELRQRLNGVRSRRQQAEAIGQALDALRSGLEWEDVEITTRMESEGISHV